MNAAATAAAAAHDLQATFPSTRLCHALPTGRLPTVRCHPSRPPPAVTMLDAAVDKLEKAQARLAAEGSSCPDLDNLLATLRGLGQAAALIPPNAMAARPGANIALPIPLPDVPWSIQLFKASTRRVPAGLGWEGEQPCAENLTQAGRDIRGWNGRVHVPAASQPDKLPAPSRCAGPVDICAGGSHWDGGHRLLHS